MAALTTRPAHTAQLVVLIDIDRRHGDGVLLFISLMRVKIPYTARRCGKSNDRSYGMAHLN